MKRSANESQRDGFTLVELLVVIAIIGILTAILVPTLAVAIRRTREASIRFELKQIEMAMEEYKVQHGSYPPDFTIKTWPGQTAAEFTDEQDRMKARVANHLKQISNKNEIDIDQFFTDIDDPDNAGYPLITPDEALVFWLALTRKNAVFPLQISRPGAARNLAYPSDDNYNSYFEFDIERLVDFDGDNIPSYVPRYGPKVPFVYFDSRTYDRARLDPQIPHPTTAANRLIPEGKGCARPYGNSTSVAWFEPEKFQIICAGYDGDYGNGRTGQLPVASPPQVTTDSDYANYVASPGQIKGYPDGSNFLLGDRDNFASFADSRLDKELD